MRCALSAAAPASAADDRNETVVSAGQSDALRVVSTAQSEVDTDPDSGSDRRLVDRESSEQVDVVVIALWTIAAVMTVMLVIFLWHTSPRRRLRLAGNGSGRAVCGCRGPVRGGGARTQSLPKDRASRFWGGR